MGCEPLTQDFRERLGKGDNKRANFQNQEMAWFFRLNSYTHAMNYDICKSIPDQDSMKKSARIRGKLKLTEKSMNTYNSGMPRKHGISNFTWQKRMEKHLESAKKEYSFLIICNWIAKTK